MVRERGLADSEGHSTAFSPPLCLTPGAFWATPLDWIIPALAQNGFASEAAAIAAAAVASFQAGGVMEAINRNIGYTGVKDYVASATNLLGVVEPSTSL